MRNFSKRENLNRGTKMHDEIFCRGFCENPEYLSPISNIDNNTIQKRPEKKNHLMKLFSVRVFKKYIH